MKKLGILLLSAVLAVCGLAVFSACDEPGHTHSFGDWKVVAEPTCTEEGLRERVCTCGEKESEEIATLGHTPGEAVKEDEVAATCTAGGSYEEVVYCAVCDEELSRKPMEVAASGHTPAEAIKENEVAATCTAGGSYEEVVYCTVCEEELSRKAVEVTALGHTAGEAVKENEVAATCTAGGSYEEVVYCTVCEEEMSRKTVEVVSFGHDYVKGVCARCGEGEPFTEGLIFELSGDGVSYTVTGYNGASTEVYIPSYYQGLPVTSIGDWAFYYCSSLTSITIPDGVTSIGDWAFHACSSLTSVTIGDSVTSIGYHAFGGCSGLTSVTIPDIVTSIGDGVFGGCSGLTNIFVDPQNPVYHSTGSHLIATKSKSLIAVCRGSMIPTDGSVTSIGADTFMACIWLESIIIPDSVTFIGEAAFGGCSRLTNISVDPQNPVYHSAGNCLIETESKTLIVGCKTSVISADGSVTSIDDYAFYNCVGLTSIMIPGSVTSIGESAFAACESLESVMISDGVTEIGGSAFAWCDSLTSITIPNSVTSIDEGVFYGCDSLTSVAIPDSVTSIGDSAFFGCDSLTTVYYRGSEAEWNEIEIRSGNSKLKDANIIFNFTGE